ncbi:hypothetical protein LUZ60_008250 [Juncus effusus]|nr:hypothetical protein LUZ60_008250 [Juncus effusus]
MYMCVCVCVCVCESEYECVRMERGSSNSNGQLEPDVRKGPWTMEEDIILFNYVTMNGDGNWNNVARAAGLNRTGKSCRLRWLNYLRPDVRRGNITQEEQMLIMELHSRLGNRWSQIAKHLPGRTDNEIKNFWRTRMQKRVKQGDQNSDEASTSATTSLTNNSELENNMSQLRMNPDQNNANLTDMIANSQFSSLESGDNFWNVDGFWSEQSFNGD